MTLIPTPKCLVYASPSAAAGAALLGSPSTCFIAQPRIKKTRTKFRDLTRGPEKPEKKTTVSARAEKQHGHQLLAFLFLKFLRFLVKEKANALFIKMLCQEPSQPGLLRQI